MRAFVPLAVLVLTLLSGPASADEEQPLVPVPDYGLEAIAPGADERPEGWGAVTQSGVIPPAAPSVASVLDFARRAEIPEQKVAVRAIPYQKESGGKRVAALLTLVAVDERPRAFTEALADAVLSSGWIVREMGSPMRVAIVWSSNGEAAREIRDWLVERVVQRTMEASVARLLAAGRSGDRTQWNAGLKLLDRASRIEPRSGFVLAVRGRMIPRERQDLALACYRGAIRAGAPAPAPDDWKAVAAARLGQLLLERSEKKELGEALAALQLAVQMSSHIQAPVERFGARYNLACAHARLGQKDAAFEHLDAALRAGKELLGAQYAFHYTHAKTRDPDMQPLRDDERFAALMAKHAPKAAEADEPEKDG